MKVRIVTLSFERGPVFQQWDEHRGGWFFVAPIPQESLPEWERDQLERQIADHHAGRKS